MSSRSSRAAARRLHKKIELYQVRASQALLLENLAMHKQHKNTINKLEKILANRVITHQTRDKLV